DGGGIRGYSNLLILKALMERIAVIEDREHYSIAGELPLPCHYFDYIFGTSTGGLNAIMLGRLRMSIDDCMREFRLLASEIFERPR
ncbi:hypothetical protein BDD12DRAFT_702439, partial [Trichophaea hybrida]